MSLVEYPFQQRLVVGMPVDDVNSLIDEIVAESVGVGVSAQPVTYASGAVISTPLTLFAGAMLKPTNLLTISASFDAPGTQVFDCTNGNVKFTDGVIDEVDPRWFGFSQSATATVNDRAIQLARDSITTRGTVRFPPGAFQVSAYTPINRSYLRFLGSEGFGTTLLPVAGAGDVTGIDFMAQPNYVNSASPYLDFCVHKGISVYRQDSQTAAVALSGTRVPLGVPTGSRGFVNRGTSNAIIDVKLFNSPIDYYESLTTGCEPKVRTVRNALTGDTGSTLRFGYVSDCTGVATTGTSSNGSSYKWWNDTVTTTTPETWGGLAYGGDLRDPFWDTMETALASHAFDMICLAPPSTLQAWDIHVTRAVHDRYTKTGMRIYGLPEASCVSLVTGYISPANLDATLGPSLDVSGSTGVSVGRGFELKGGPNYPNHVGCLLQSGAAGCNIQGKFTGCNLGVVVDASSLNVVSPMTNPHSGQNMTAAVTLRNGSSRNLVEAGMFGGAATTAYGIDIDASSTYNTVGANGVNPGTVTTPIRISGAAITVSGTTNHNKVTDGAIPPA